MTKLSIITSLVIGSTIVSFGATDIASAFKEGKWEGRIRFQYFYTDWDDNSVAGKNGSDAKGLAVGGSIIYKTAPLYGFSLGTGLYTTQNPGFTDVEDGVTAATSKDLFCRDIGCKYGDGLTTLAQMYLGYDFALSKTKAGRFLMTNPWVTPNDTKMIPIAVQGAEIISGDIPNTLIQFDYMNKIKERGMSSFADTATTGDTPDKIKTYFLGKDDPAAYMLNIKNHSIDNLELQASGMHWDNIIDQGILEANYAFEAGNEAIISLGARYIKQFDKGAGDIILPQANNGDHDNSVDTSTIMGRAVINYESAKLLLAVSGTDDDGDLIAPWRGFPTDGYTRSMTQTDWNAGTKAYKIGLDYDWGNIIDGFGTSLSYSKYNRDESKKPYQSMTNRGFQNGDTAQWNLDIIQKLSGKFDGVELKLRLMDQDNKPTTLYPKETSNREVRLEANYRF